MPAAATRTVTGYVLGLTADQLEGASLLLDLDPQYVAVGDTLVVGEQNSGTKGVPVSLGSDGSFTVAIIAVDNPTWDISAQIVGPNVETPIAIKIVPPPATGSGNVGIGRLIRDPDSGAPPIAVVTLGGLLDVDLTGADVGDSLMLLDTGKWGPGTPSGGGGGAVSSVNGKTGSVTLSFGDVGAVSSSDGRLNDAREPLPHADTHAAGATDPITPESIGAIDGSDSRLSDARTPLAHASSHASGGSDALSAAAIGAMGVRTWRRRDLPVPVVADALYSGPTPTITTTKQATSTIAGAQALIAPDTGPFSYAGAANFTYGTGTPNSAYYSATSRYPNSYVSPISWSQNTWSVEFGTDASVLEIKFNAASATATMCRVFVDGQKLTDLMQNPGTWGGLALTAGSSHVLKIDLGAAGSAPRKWRIDFYNMPFGGIFLPATASIWKPPLHGGRLLAFGDSITDGSAYNTGQGAGTWLYRAARLMGIADVWDQARGGTGYITAGSYDTLPNRVATDVVPYNPDRVIVWAGYNDNGGSQAAIASAADSVFAAINAIGSRPDTYVIGCYSPLGSPTAGLVNTDNTLQQRAQIAGIPFISPITGIVYNAAGGSVMNQGPWITAANQSTYVNATDNVHPNDAGHIYLARRIVHAVSALLNP
jgi:lysophospholipase L1-like esterase